MKRIIVIVLLCLSLVVIIAAQSESPFLIPIWSGTRYVFPKLGPTLVLNGNQLDALLPVIPVRRRDVLLVYDQSAQGWRLPPGASNIVVYVNGLRYREGSDYVITNEVIKAQFDNMLPEHQVGCDFDTQMP